MVVNNFTGPGIGLGFGIGCGFGVGWGFGGMPLNMFGLGIGGGCIVGLGLGWGFGKAYVVSIDLLESSFRALSFRRRLKEMKHRALFLQSVLKNLVLMDSMAVPYNSHKPCYLPSLNYALVLYLHVSSVAFDAYVPLWHFCCNQNDVNGQDFQLCCQLMFYGFNALASI